MWWRADAGDVGRIQDRVSTLYLDKCRIDRHNQAIVVETEVEELSIPAAMIACLLLGPGTTVTHGAITLMADAGVTVAWVGQNTVRLYATGQSTARSSRIIENQARLVSRPAERLRVARAMYSMRFPGEDVSRLTMQQLLGREGSRVKRLYSQHATRTGLQWKGRHYIPGKPFEAGDDLNRLLSAANAALYGICHAAIVGIGASPALGFVHAGAWNSFVLDIADIYKAETTIPLAFDLAAAGKTTERDARLAMLDYVVRARLMARIPADIIDLLEVDGTSINQPAGLWSGVAGTEVPGGVNYDKASAAQANV